MDQPSTRIDQVVDGIYRISTWVPPAGITFNQFLIDDERPALIHTGMHDLYGAVRGAVAEVMDPARLEFVALLHFEADECGGMDRFLAEAPESTLVGSALSAGVNLGGWDYRGKVQGFADGEMLDLGRHRLRFLETPHVHHWDSMMIFEESTRSVFPADLYLQPGEQPVAVDQDLGEEMCGYYRELGIFAHEQPVRAVVDRIEALQPEWMHAMHGGSLTREVIPRYTRALRERPFAYDGRLLGRNVVENGTPGPAWIRRVMPNVVTEDLEASRRFYTDFLGLEVAMDETGFLMLSSATNPTAELTVVSAEQDDWDPNTGRTQMAIEVGDVEAVHADAKRRGLRIVYPLHDEPWGIRRFFVEDPSGTVINVHSHIDPA